MLCFCVCGGGWGALCAPLEVGNGLNMLKACGGIGVYVPLPPQHEMGKRLNMLKLRQITSTINRN